MSHGYEAVLDTDMAKGRSSSWGFNYKELRSNQSHLLFWKGHRRGGNLLSKGICVPEESYHQGWYSGSMLWSPEFTWYTYLRLNPFPALLLRSGLENVNIGKHLRLHPVGLVQVRPISNKRERLIGVSTKLLDQL